MARSAGDLNVVGDLFVKGELVDLVDTSRHLPLLAETRALAGGTIGTAAKPVVSFRIDHGIDPFLADFWPLFLERGIPVSLGVVSDAVGNGSDPFEPTTTTWAELQAAWRGGFEVWSHSASHLDLPDTGNTLEEEIAGSRTTIEGNGIAVRGWQMPGILTVTTDDYGAADFGGAWESQVGRLLLANYGLIEAGGGASTRRIPTFGCYDLGHRTLDPYNLSSALALLDADVLQGLSTQWMVHPTFVDAATVTWTLTDMEDFLDEVVALRDAGDIMVLTGSGLSFADPSHDYRADEIRNNNFDEQASPITTVTSPWARGGASSGTQEIVTAGDGPYLRQGSDVGFSYVQQGFSVAHAQGATYEVTAEVRCTGSDTEARIQIIHTANDSLLNIDRWWDQTAGAGWVKIRTLFTVPLDVPTVGIRVSRRVGSGTLEWRDVHCQPV